MIDKERAIFGQYGWRKITKCADCPIKNDLIITYEGAVIHEKKCGELDFEIWHSDIEDEKEILKNCPLPLWAKVKSHNPKEDKPGKLEVVLIKFKDASDSGFTKIRSGCLNDTHIPTWTVHGYGVLEDKDIIEWIYI